MQKKYTHLVFGIGLLASPLFTYGIIRIEFNALGRWLGADVLINNYVLPYVTPNRALVAFLGVLTGNCIAHYPQFSPQHALGAGINAFTCYYCVKKLYELTQKCGSMTKIHTDKKLETQALLILLPNYLNQTKLIEDCVNMALVVTLQTGFNIYLCWQAMVPQTEGTKSEKNAVAHPKELHAHHSA